MKAIALLIIAAALAGCAGISASKYHSVTDYSGIGPDGVPIPVRQEVSHTLRIASDATVEELKAEFASYNETATLGAARIERSASKPIEAKGDADKKRIDSSAAIIEDVVPLILNPLPAKP
jgi:hypothetical protein